MNKKRNWILLGTLVVLIGASVWGSMVYLNSRAVAKVKALGEEAFNAEGDQRAAAWQQFRDASEQLTEQQRDSMRQDMMRPMMERRMAEIDSFFTLDSVAQRNAFLDERIREMEQRREQWEQRRREREANGESANGQGNGPGRGGPAAGGGPPGGGRGGPGRGNRNEWISRIYDNTTPDQRAKYTAFREAMQQRREELGLPERGEWGGGRRRG